MDKLCYRCLQYTMENGRCTACHSPAVIRPAGTDPHVLPLGTKLDDGNIIVGDKLGAGGFGITYIARDKYFGLIALKEFYPASSVSRQGLNVVPASDRQHHFEKAKKDFLREIKHLLLLKDHPHIVNVLFDLKENGTCYYGMELLKGQTLAKYLQQNGPMSPADAYTLLEPIMDALSYMHERNCLHRDVAPDNIFLRSDETLPMKLSPCLIDFGAAFTDRESFTYVAPNVGKAGFSPPDQRYEVQLQGPYTDVYALCATYYYMLTKVVPVPSDRRLLDTEMKPPSQFVPSIPSKIDTIVMDGMQLDTKKRTQTVREVRDRLREAIVKPRPPIPSPPIPQPHPFRNSDSIVAPGNLVDYHPDAQKRIGVKGLFSCILEWLLCFGAGMLLTRSPLGLLLGYFLNVALNVACCQLLDGATLGQLMLSLTTKGNQHLLAHLIYGSLRAFVPIQLIAELVRLLDNDSGCFTERLAGLTVCLRNEADPLSGDMLSGGTPDAHQPITPEKHPMSYTDQKPVSPPPSSSTQNPTLQCISGSMSGLCVQLQNGMTVGRNPQMNCYIDKDHTVSNLHCSFHSRGSDWYIRDDGSTNGTFINQKRLTPKEYTLIHQGDMIRIGSQSFVYHAK